MGTTSSNHWFSGDMLVFRGVSHQKWRLKNQNGHLLEFEWTTIWLAFWVMQCPCLSKTKNAMLGTVDGRNIEPVDMAHIYDYAIACRVSYISGGLGGFLNHQQYPAWSFEQLFPCSISKIWTFFLVCIGEENSNSLGYHIGPLIMDFVKSITQHAEKTTKTLHLIA